MTEQTELYLPQNPGDLITAEAWNALQKKIKEDIARQVAEAKKEIIETGVNRADNADKFDNRTPKNWVDELDQRYAQKMHEHEGQPVYRRYFKRLRAGQTIVLQHNLGRFPLVDVYELLSIGPDLSPAITEQFYLYYHHEERDQAGLFVEDRSTQRSPLGTPLEQLLEEYQVEWEDDDSLGDVINDFLEAFFKAPVVDHFDHKTSKWINDHRGSIISNLKKRDEWPDIRWALHAEKLIVGNMYATIERAVFVNIQHLSYDTLAITSPEARDLMILLRS